MAKDGFRVFDSDMRLPGPMIDPITLEVVREGLSSIVREMRVTLLRTAYSSIL